MMSLYGIPWTREFIALTFKFFHIKYFFLQKTRQSKIFGSIISNVGELKNMHESVINSYAFGRMGCGSTWKYKAKNVAVPLALNLNSLKTFVIHWMTSIDEPPIMMTNSPNLHTIHLEGINNMMQFDATRVTEIFKSLAYELNECGRNFVASRTHKNIVSHYEITDRLRRVFLDGYNIFKRSKKSREFLQTIHSSRNQIQFTT